MAEDKKGMGAVDAWAAIQKMRDTLGWKLLMERYAKEGDEILTKMLDINIDHLAEYDKKYGIRDLYAFQLNALGRLAKVIDEFETEAKAKDDGHKAPKHIGV